MAVCSTPSTGGHRWGLMGSRKYFAAFARERSPPPKLSSLVAWHSQTLLRLLCHGGKPYGLIFLLCVAGITPASETPRSHCDKEVWMQHQPAPPRSGLETGRPRRPAVKACGTAWTLVPSRWPLHPCQRLTFQQPRDLPGRAGKTVLGVPRDPSHPASLRAAPLVKGPHLPGGFPVL